MRFLNRLSDRTKGIILIVGGVLLVFNVLGITTEIIRMLVLLGSIGLVVLGIYLANFHTYIFQTLKQWRNKDS